MNIRYIGEKRRTQTLRLFHPLFSSSNYQFLPIPLDRLLQKFTFFYLYKLEIKSQCGNQFQVRVSVGEREKLKKIEVVSSVQYLFGRYSFMRTVICCNIIDFENCHRVPS